MLWQHMVQGELPPSYKVVSKPQQVFVMCVYVHLYIYIYTCIYIYIYIHIYIYIIHNIYIVLYYILLWLELSRHVRFTHWFRDIVRYSGKMNNLTPSNSSLLFLQGILSYPIVSCLVLDLILSVHPSIHPAISHHKYIEAVNGGGYKPTSLVGSTKPRKAGSGGHPGRWEAKWHWTDFVVTNGDDFVSFALGKICELNNAVHLIKTIYIYLIYLHMCIYIYIIYLHMCIYIYIIYLHECAGAKHM